MAEGKRSDVKSIIPGESTSVLCAAMYYFTRYFPNSVTGEEPLSSGGGQPCWGQSLFYFSVCNGCIFSSHLMQLNWANSLSKCLINITRYEIVLQEFMKYVRRGFFWLFIFKRKTILLWLIWGWTANEAARETRLWLESWTKDLEKDLEKTQN